MKFLLFYKGHYGASLRGPEMRYAALANELVALGHEAVLCGRTGDNQGIPKRVGFVPVSNVWLLLKAFLRSDVIMLHGGGPLVLLLAILSGLFGKSVVLDGYVPHWVELDEVINYGVGSSTFKLLFKAYFNVARSLLGALVFNQIIVANKRQLDMFRGMMAPFLLTHDFSRITVIPFGCDEQKDWSRKSGKVMLAELANNSFASDDFLIGWLGGTYGWFDLGGVLTEVSKAISKNNKINMIFFGVDENRQAELLAFVDTAVRQNIVFLPWIDFSRRLEYWAGFDISLVWGGQGYENDYASRTRNFDCLTLGLPIVQNDDDEWGYRLEQTGAGLVVKHSDLADVLVELSNCENKVTAMRESMTKLAPKFYWSRFTVKLIESATNSPMSRGRRLVGLIGFCMVLPAISVFFIFTLVTTLFKRS
ncbi:hypothetical protein HVA01_33330 [Halovibrio variabilis]|uniref:Glycosyltransferase subfamily 4-like N-terminal domain-containing protein n=1 Tax=Halovibrio variabilis TaxID=31910 RepID=A0A511USV9_9GAMM|nr:hypothetical protein [Halovibrio variabilis]GEN29687.1 hypothetical protein HVA01_33330 [Halovibrio variabilis]